MLLAKYCGEEVTKRCLEFIKEEKMEELNHFCSVGMNLSTHQCTTCNTKTYTIETIEKRTCVICNNQK